MVDSRLFWLFILNIQHFSNLTSNCCNISLEGLRGAASSAIPQSPEFFTTSHETVGKNLRKAVLFIDYFHYFIPWSQYLILHVQHNDTWTEKWNWIKLSLDVNHLLGERKWWGLQKNDIVSSFMPIDLNTSNWTFSESIFGT